MAALARPRRPGITLALLLSVLLLVARAPASARAADPVVAAAGDIACAPTDQDFNAGSGTTTACRQGATAALLRNLAPTSVITLGDNQYEAGEFDNFQKSFDPSWGQSSAPLHPSIGNREYRNGIAGAAQGYFTYFGARAGEPSKGYYSYDLGDWHLIALNSNCSKLDHPTTVVDGCALGSPQEQWLQADLAAHPASCTLAYWHHPLLTSATESMDGSVTPLWRDLYNAGADLVLNGHAHDYERFAQQKPDGTLDPARGIREFVVGTGGKSHHLFDKPEGFEHSEIRNNDTFGVLQLSLHTGSYDWKFVPDPGSSPTTPPFSDSGSTPCHKPRADFSTSASPSPPTPNQSIAFNAAGSTDPDGTIASYSWDFGDGAPKATTTDANTSHQFASAGTKQVTLTITDSSGLKATTTRSVRVDAPPTPDFTFVPTAPRLGDSVTFDGTKSSDADGSIASYAWDFDGDGRVDSTDPTPTHTFSAAGPHEVTLTVTDDLGLSRQVVKSVSVDAPPTAAFSSSPDAPKTGDAVTFDGSGSKDPDGTIATYAWNFGDGTTATATGPSTAHSFATAGVYRVTLTVTDDSGSVATTAGTTTVADRPPSAAFTLSPAAPTTDDTVTFDASGSKDPDGTVKTYGWDFGDGQTATTAGPTTTHRFAGSGSYDVKLTVTDDSGSVAGTNQVLTVAQPAPPAGGGTSSGGGSTPPSGGSGGTSPSGSFPRDPFTAPLDTTPPTVSMVVPPWRLATVLRKGLSPLVRCSEACRVVSTLTIPRPAAAALGLRPRTATVAIGRGVLELRADAQGRVVVALTRRARTALGRVRAVRVTLRTEAADLAGNVTRLTRTITLRR